MIGSTITGDFGTLRVETEMIDVTTSLPGPDKRWVYTDHQGHQHYWRNGYPTLVVVEDATWWCEDCHDEHTDEHWECRLCNEHITPGLSPPSMVREYMPGRVAYYLNDEPISEAEAKRILATALPTERHDEPPDLEDR